MPEADTLTGYNCQLHGLSWISTTSGEARLISITVYPPASAFAAWNPVDRPNVGAAYQGVGYFDLQNPNIGYK